MKKQPEFREYCLCFYVFIIFAFIRYFSGLFGSSCDTQRIFTVEYGPSADASLAPHFDDSELTANVCLENDSPENGLLEFEKIGVFEQRPNYAIVHEGKLVHSEGRSRSTMIQHV